jgi:hypothetical protein
MSPGSPNDKTEAVPVPVKLSARRFFSRSKRQEKTQDDEKDGIDDDATKVNAPVSKSVAPVSLIQLFRYVSLERLSGVCMC